MDASVIQDLDDTGEDYSRYRSHELVFTVVRNFSDLFGLRAQTEKKNTHHILNACPKKFESFSLTNTVLSAISSDLYASASALNIVPSFPLEMISTSSVGSLPNHDELSDANIASRIISRCWGAMLVAEGIVWVGSTRKATKILRTPGLVGSSRRKGWTWCW